MKTVDAASDEQFRYNDEVSLRDLYLILKKGALWIVLVAVLAGVAAFLYFSLQPDTYSAESTTLVTPLAAGPMLGMGVENITVAEGVTVQFETYETLAKSRPVIEAVLQRVPQFDGGLRDLERSMSLSRLLGPASPGQSIPLAVTHTVSNPSPELAAELADAWAESTLEVVRESILDDLRPMREATTQALTTAQVQLEEIELELRDFRASDEISQRRGQLEAAESEIISAEQTLRSLENSVAVAQAERAELLQQIETEQSLLTTTDLTSTTFLAGMTLGEASAFVNSQLERARADHTAAREELRDFDRTSGLSLLTARQDFLESTVAEDTATLMNLERRIALAEARLESQLAELGLQPERLVVVQSLLDDEIMLESWRAQANLGDLSEQAELTVFSEQFNPHYQSLIGQTIDTRLSIADLSDRLVSLTESVVEFEAELQEVRNERVAIQNARAQLELDASEAQAQYESLASSSLPLQLASQRPEAEALTLTSGSGTVAQLRTEVRQLDRNLVTLNSRRAETRADIEELGVLIAGHRDAVATLNQARTSLDRELALRRSAFDSVAAIQPLLEFVGSVAPGSARIMTEAVTLEEPEGGRLLPTVIAAIVAGLLATVFVFLREAVRDPAPAIRPRATAVGAASPSTD